jgi:hypothetical protein
MPPPWRHLSLLLNELFGMEIKAFRLNALDFADYFPAGFDQNRWYGVYFINGCDYAQPGECDPSVVLLNAGFDFIRRHLS